MTGTATMRRVDIPLDLPWEGWVIGVIDRTPDGRYHFSVDNRAQLVQLEGWARVERDIMANAETAVRRWAATGDQA